MQVRCRYGADTMQVGASTVQVRCKSGASLVQVRCRWRRHRRPASSSSFSSSSSSSSSPVRGRHGTGTTPRGPSDSPPTEHQEARTTPLRPDTEEPERLTSDEFSWARTTYLRPNTKGPERRSSDRTPKGSNDSPPTEHRRARTTHLSRNTEGFNDSPPTDHGRGSTTQLLPDTDGARRLASDRTNRNCGARWDGCFSCPVTVLQGGTAAFHFPRVLFNDVGRITWTALVHHNLAFVFLCLGVDETGLHRRHPPLPRPPSLPRSSSMTLMTTTTTTTTTTPAASSSSSSFTLPLLLLFLLLHLPCVPATSRRI